MCHFSNMGLGIRHAMYLPALFDETNAIHYNRTMNMRNYGRLFCTLFSCALLASACDEKPKNPVSEYSDALIGAHTSAKLAGETANLDAVKKAVQVYRAANGKYPAVLEDVGDLIGGNVDFSKYDYSPETGAVSLKK
jgi:hypothetical protein